MKRTIIFNSLIALLLLAVGCRHDFEPDCSDAATESIMQTDTPKETGITLGRRFDNPYSIKNMKAVLAELNKTRSDGEDIEVKVTDLYVRFLPKDGNEYDLLKDSLKLELFSYPLDCEIIGTGADYHDPSIPDDEMTWQYTTVKPDFKFPDNIKCEILEECCIPDIDGEAELTRSGNAGLARQIEYMALERVGYIQHM